MKALDKMNRVYGKDTIMLEVFFIKYLVRFL